MISVDINVRSELQKVQKQLSSLAYQQLPFATSTALTALAKRVQMEEKKNLSDTFKNPTPFTKNSIGIKAAQKNNPEAIVYMKDIAAQYLAPYEFGGDHFLSGKALLNPKDITLNQYGNIPRNTIARLKNRKDIFIGQVKTRSGEVVNGVWQRPSRMPTGNQRHSKRMTKTANTSGHLKLLIRFGRSLPVKQHLKYFEMANKIVKQHFNAEFGSALAKAISTAR
ncbi:MAG: hypothetical protein KGI54_10340 [Pseudomonadota bacterium]|nr:hypothetical protein [Pseudomonadota bacterium]